MSQAQAQSHSDIHHKPERAKPTIRTAYGPHIHVLLSCPELPFGRTKQSFGPETDINYIMEKFQRTGVLDFVEKRQPQFGDTTGIDFEDSMNLVIEAQAMFDDLPSKLRDRFANDPVRLLQFLEDPSNRSEAVLLGLVNPPATPLAETTTAPKSAPPAPDSGAGEGGKGAPAPK